MCYPDPRESHWAVTHRRLFAGLAFELDGHGCISNYNKSIEYYPGERRAIFGVDDGFAPAVATFATDFEIEYRKTYKILRNLLSHDVYVLRQCGTPAELQDLPAYAVGATVFEVPVSSWSTGGTIAVSYLEELGLGPQAAIVDPTWVTSPCVQKLVGCGVTASWDQAGG